ncbi:ADP-ribosyltransferase [Phaeodactylibacter xiamenensis]|uniref:ADP-ribosyltransferase n=1 Tax=Phaeodactylibacter xiamenensis TaxID=1524460 RepID=UPI0024A91370|nr:ADP-ribosyltransferase [Phaeodactylibacter xiamenensis]
MIYRLNGYALRVLKEYPDEYVSALESFGLVKGDLFTRHGVDYDDEFFEIMDDFILNNTNGLSKSEVYSIFGYTTNFFYQDLNYWLREGINTSQTSGIKDLIDSGLAKLPSWNGQSQIYRGIKITGGDAQLQSILSNYQINNPITELQFTSVSASSNTAFLNHANTKIKMTITLKPDSRVRDISALSDGVFYRGFPPPELLFPSAISFHVDDIVESSNGVSTIFLTEL